MTPQEYEEAMEHHVNIVQGHLDLARQYATTPRERPKFPETTQYSDAELTSARDLAYAIYEDLDDDLYEREGNV